MRRRRSRVETHLTWSGAGVCRSLGLFSESGEGVPLSVWRGDPLGFARH